MSRVGRASAAGLLAVLTVGPVLGLLTPASAESSDASITTASSAAGRPATSITPFAGAVVSGDGTLDGITLRIARGFDSSVDVLSLAGPSPRPVAVLATVGACASMPQCEQLA